MTAASTFKFEKFSTGAVDDEVAHLFPSTRICTEFKLRKLFSRLAPQPNLFRDYSSMQLNYEELERCDNDAQPLYPEDIELSKLLGDSFEEVIIAGKHMGKYGQQRSRD